MRPRRILPRTRHGSADATVLGKVYAELLESLTIFTDVKAEQEDTWFKITSVQDSSFIDLALAFCKPSPHMVERTWHYVLLADALADARNSFTFWRYKKSSRVGNEDAIDYILGEPGVTICVENVSTYTGSSA